MDISNLMDNVRAFFTAQYKGVDESASFIAFEPLGSVIDPADFVDENNNVSYIKATEQLSLLGDRLPIISDIFLPHTGRLSTAYEMLIESAVFTGTSITAEDMTPYIARFSEVKAEALAKLQEGRKASITTPEGNYLPVYARPQNWYDPAANFWVNKTFSENEKMPATPVKPLSPDAVSSLFKWKTRLASSPQGLNTTVEGTAAKFTTAKHLRRGAIGKVKDFTPASLAIKHLNNRIGHEVFLQNAESAVVKGNYADAKLSKPLNKVSFADRIKITEHLAAESAGSATPVHSNGFSMSFDYCLVYLDRPWFNTALFTYSSLWYCLSLQENYFSTGTKDETNTGMLRSIPSAMILIKNLRITAAWTDEDRNNAKSSAGLGVFNLNDSTFSNNELSTPGIQIIGWVCDVMPKLPALTDTNLKP